MILQDTDEIKTLKKELKDVAEAQFGGLKTEDQFADFMMDIKSRNIGIIQKDAFIELFDHLTEGRFFVGIEEDTGKIGFDPYVPSLEESGLSIEENISQNFNDLEYYVDIRRYLRWAARQEDSMWINPKGGDIYFSITDTEEINNILKRYTVDQLLELGTPEMEMTDEESKLYQYHIDRIHRTYGKYMDDQDMIKEFIDAKCEPENIEKLKELPMGKKRTEEVAPLHAMLYINSSRKNGNLHKGEY